MKSPGFYSKVVFLFAIFFVGIAVFWAWKNSAKWAQTSQKGQAPIVSVVASFYPLAEFASQVGGELTQVRNLTPAGTEPHDYEPTPQDMASIESAHLFLYNGTGFEHWANDFLPNLPSSVQVFSATADVDLIGQDPHVWMDPVMAHQIVGQLLTKFIAVDTVHQDRYQQNAAQYQQELSALDQAFKAGLANCQSRTIVTSHNAFAYLARRYNLKVVSIAGLSPDEEPSAQKLAEIARYVKQNDIQYIFFETLVSPKLSQTIATETGAQTIAFNPIEGLTEDEILEGKNYLSVQYDNLHALQKALGCQK